MKYNKIEDISKDIEGRLDYVLKMLRVIKVPCSMRIQKQNGKIVAIELKSEVMGEWKEN